MEKKIILIAGGSGFLGREIGNHLETKDYTVRVLTRTLNKKLNFEQFLWDPESNILDHAAFEKVYGVINLAGASLADRRWSNDYKLELVRSRVYTTRFLVNEINSLKSKPKVFITNVGIGIYGHRPDEILTESSDITSSGFIPSLCRDWEEAARGVSNEVRAITLRTGIVLGLNGGFMSKTKFTSKLGLSPIFGNGSQIYSWVHINDVCKAIQFIMENSELNGVINLAAPNPIPQSAISRLISRRFLGIEVPLPIPISFLRILIGEMANTLLESQYVLPKKLLDHGFKFQFSDIHEALNGLVPV